MPASLPPVVDDPLFFLDYDGTLAPLVEDPMRAFPHPEVETLLATLEQRFPVWIVTGRYLADLSVFFERPFRAIGLHGMQEGTIGGAARITVEDAAREAIDRMRATIPVLDGLAVEDKGPTFAVHYRRVADEAAARERLQAWMAGMPDVLNPIWGKKVVEVRPHGIDKGVAVRRVAAAHPERVPLYLGDDVTDEDAFAALHALRDDAVTVKVGEGETQARYRLADVEAVVAYLKRYVEG